jgi:hypothetical protein
MNSSNRRVVTLGAAALTCGIVTGAIFLSSANSGSGALAALCTTTGSGGADEALFLAENNAAMTKMMNDMAVKPTGNVDLDFVAMMAPHHQGAIDMALAVLRYGHNPQIKRLAQEVIVTQQQEIAAMRLAVSLPLPPSVASPTQPSPRPELDDHHSMWHDSMPISPAMKMK